MATFRSGVKILGHISRTKGHGGIPLRSRSCDRRTLNIQNRQESAFVVQDSCEDSLKETQRSRSWLSIFSRNRSPDSAAEEERTLKKEDESWFSYFSKKPLQVNEKKETSKAVNQEGHIPTNKKQDKYLIRTVHSDITRENISTSISKGAVCHFHKGTNIMSPKSTVVQPLSREIAHAYGRSGFHSIPTSSHTNDKITPLTKNVATQKPTDVNYSSMVTQNSQASTSLPYTAADVQNVLMMSLSNSSHGCSNPYSFKNSEVRRNSHKGISQDKSSIIDFGSQNLQLNSSPSRITRQTSDIGAMKPKGNIKQQVGLPQHKLQSQPSLTNAYADKANHKALYSESPYIDSVSNDKQKREREAFLKTKALISMKPEASTQNSKSPSGKVVLQNTNSSSNDYNLLKYKPLKLNIKPKGKALDHITNPYISESKPKTQKSKYISDSPLIKQKSHPTQFHVHPSMIANSSIPLRLSSSTAGISEKYVNAFEESKIYNNDIKGPITFSSIINKIDATAENSYMPPNFRNKQALDKKPNMDNVLGQEYLVQREHFIGMNQATKLERGNATKVSYDPQSNTEIQSCSTQETATEMNSKVIVEHNHTKQNGYSKMVTVDHSQKPNDIDGTNKNTAEEIMLEKKHKYREELTENMRSKFGMHMPYFKNQNNISAFKKSKNNKTNKNELLNLNTQKDAAKPLLCTSPKLTKQKEVDETEADKTYNNETLKGSPRTALEEEQSQQKTEVLSEMSKPLDSKAVTAEDISNKNDKDIGNECETSTNEMKRSETVSDELPELTLQADGPNEDSVEMHQQVKIEKPAPPLRRHRYFPNYFSKRSLSCYTDPPGFGEKSEISCCPGKEKGSANDKCKKIGTPDEKHSKTKTCTKVTEPGCEIPKSTICKPPLPSDECNKRMAPAPSYSECVKNPISPKVLTECDPHKDLECPGEKQRKDYDACRHQLQENVCGDSNKRKRQTDEETFKTDNTCPEDTKCPEPYKGQKTMGNLGSPMKCQFQNCVSTRFYSTSKNENPLLRNINSSTVCPNPMISLCSFHHKKIECKGGCKDTKPAAEKTCKKIGKKEDKKKKPVCVKVQQEGCVIPKSTLCVPPTNFEKCNKVLAPKPSYSECMKSVEIPPRRFAECDTTVDLECPIKRRKNYDACHPSRKTDNNCPPKQDKKPVQWKDNTCPKEEECPTNGKKASNGISKAAIKCLSINKTAAYLPPRRYFSCTSGRYILKSYSSPALESSSLHKEEMIYTPFIVAKYMRNDSPQQPSHERNTQKGKPFVTLSNSYSSSPIFLDYMAFKSSCKCKNCIPLNINFLQKIGPDSPKVSKVAQCMNSNMSNANEAEKRTGIKGMEMERLFEKAISRKYRLSRSCVSKAKCLTYGCLLHKKQDMVPERTYCTWSTIKQSTKNTSQKKNIRNRRQCSSFKKKKGSSDSLNEPCPPEAQKEKKDDLCETISAEKPFGDCPSPKKEKAAGCPPPRRMKVVAPPRPVTKEPVTLDCPKPPKKVQHKCEDDTPPPPPPPPPEKPILSYAECSKPKLKVKVACAEEVKEEVLPPAPACKYTDPVPFTQCPKPKSKARRTCEEHETPSDPCKDGKKHKSENPHGSTKMKASEANVDE